jgi:hypothetical protein
MCCVHLRRAFGLAVAALFIVALSPHSAAGQEHSYWGGRWNFSEEHVFTDPMTKAVVTIRPAHAYAFYRPYRHRREDFSLNIYCVSGQPVLRLMGIDGTQLPSDIRPEDILEIRWRFDDTPVSPWERWKYTVDPGAPTERWMRVRTHREGAIKLLERDSPLLSGLRNSRGLWMQVRNQRNGLVSTLNVEDGLKGSSSAMGQLDCVL